MTLKTKFTAIISGGILCAQAHAFSYWPLSPSWFGSAWDSYVSPQKHLWGGVVQSVSSPTQLTIKSDEGRVIKVNLLHLGLPEGATTVDYSTAYAALKATVGMYTYVLGPNDSDEVKGILVDGKGKDLNLILVRHGVLDVNTSSLMFEPRKNEYKYMLKLAQTFHAGIWQGHSK